MIFLIRYDRAAGKIGEFLSFNDSDREGAEAERLSMELRFAATGSQYEIVLLEADSKADLHETHRRYFSSARDLLKAAVESTTASAS